MSKDKIKDLLEKGIPFKVSEIMRGRYSLLEILEQYEGKNKFIRISFKGVNNEKVRLIVKVRKINIRYYEFEDESGEIYYYTLRSIESIQEVNDNSHIVDW